MYIREARQADYPAICQLFKTEEELFLAYPAARFPLTLENLQQLAKERLSLTVLESEKCIAGFANLYNLTPAESVFIGNVIINRQQRGKGLGRTLVQYMMNQVFEDLKLEKACISVFRENRPAIMLYSSLGFSAYGDELKTDSNGKKWQLVHMSLENKEYLSTTHPERY